MGISAGSGRVVLAPLGDVSWLLPFCPPLWQAAHTVAWVLMSPQGQNPSHHRAEKRRKNPHRTNTVARSGRIKIANLKFSVATFIEKSHLWTWKSIFFFSPKWSNSFEFFLFPYNLNYFRLLNSFKTLHNSLLSTVIAVQ